jgi:ornithine decarboxylase
LKYIQAVLGVNFEEDVIFANPIKIPSHMEYAKELGVSHSTFDCEEELYKYKKFWPNSKLVIRIKVDDHNSTSPFSTKFGVPMEKVSELLTKAKELNLNCVGTSFHVGIYFF